MLLSPENLRVQPLLLEQRLRVPLVGIAGITCTRDLNFSTFQLTSQGDLFYQSFAPSSIEQDRTLAAGPGSKDLPVVPSCVKQWTQWAGEAQALEDVKWLSQLEQAKFLVPKKEDDFIVVNPDPVKKCKNRLCPVNSLRPRQNVHHFPDHIFKCFFVNENIWILIKISLKCVCKGSN